MDNLNLTKKSVIIALLLLFVIAPLSGYLLAKFTGGSDNLLNPAKQPARTTSEMQSVLQNKLKGTDPSLKNLTISSMKRYDSWWYVIQAKVYGGNTKILVGDFHPSVDDINIIYGPDDYSNKISEAGVPYELVDMFSQQKGSNG